MPSKKKNYDYDNYTIKSGWVQEQQEGPLYGQGRNYSRQSYDQDMLASNFYPIFDDKQIKDVLKGIQIKDELSNPTEVHQHGHIIVPIFCQEGYGVNYVKQRNPDYSQLTPDRYKSIIKAVIRRSIRVLETVVRAGQPNSEFRQKITNLQYNRISTPLMHSEKRMPLTYKLIFYKLLKQAYGVGPSITREEGKKLFIKLKEAANNKTTFFEDNQPGSDQLDDKFRALALKSLEKRQNAQKPQSINTNADYERQKKKHKNKKDTAARQYKYQADQHSQYNDYWKYPQYRRDKAKHRTDLIGGQFNNDSESDDREKSSYLSPIRDPYDENYHANNYWTARYDMSDRKKRKRNSKNKLSNLDSNKNNSPHPNPKPFQTKPEESQNQSTGDQLIWPDQVQFYMYELMIEKLSYKFTCEAMTKKYPQNTDFFTEVQLQHEIQKKVSRMFKDITEKYSKVCLKESIVNQKESSPSKPISLFLMLKTHHNKIYRFLMRSNSTKEPRKLLLKLYLAAIKQAAATPGKDVNTMSFDVSKNDILQLQKELNAAFDKKVTSDNIKRQQFNGDYDEALQTDTDDFTQTHNYQFRHIKKFTNSRVNFDQEEKLFISDLQSERDWNDPTKFDFLKEKNPYDDIGDKEKAIEDYLRQPVKKSNFQEFGQNLEPPVPRSRKSRSRKSQSSANKGKQRPKSKGRSYKSVLRNPDILGQYSGSDLDQHDEYDWFHEQQKNLQALRYGNSAYNDYGYDYRGLVSSFKISSKAGGSRHMLSEGRIIEEGGELNGGVIEID